MRIESSIIQYQQNASSTSRAELAPDQNNALSSKLPSTESESSTVTISGKSLMLSRLFGGAEPEVKSGNDGMSIYNIGISSVNYLTQQDRNLVSKMYAFAQQQGADLQYVDTLAIDLGDYRKTDNGRIMMSFNNGTNFDFEGHLMTVNFGEEDAKTAERILNGESIKTTQIDRGFLQYTLDAGNGALDTMGNLQFLEKMVTRFSSEGANANVSLREGFSTFSRSDATVNRAVFTKSKEILSPYPAADFVADYGSIDGVGFWRTPELAAANGRGSQTATAILDLLENFEKKSDNFNQSLINMFLKTDKHANND